MARAGSRAGRRSSTTPSTSPGCAPPAPSRSARRRRPSSAPGPTPPARPSASPATRGTRRGRRAARAAARRRRLGRHGAVLHGQRRWRVDPHPGRLHRTRRPEVPLRADPHLRRHVPGPERRRRVADDDGGRHRPAPRRDGRARTNATGPACPPPGLGYLDVIGRPERSRGCGWRGRATSASPSSNRRWRVARAAADDLVEAAGLTLVDRAVELDDYIATYARMEGVDQFVGHRPRSSGRTGWTSWTRSWRRAGARPAR